MTFVDSYVKFCFRDRFFFVSTALALAGNILNWIFIFLKHDILINPEREFISLHYKVFLGPDFYGPWQYIYFIPFTLLCIILVNYMLARNVYHVQRVSAYGLCVTSVVCQAAALLATHLIIAVNIF